MTPQPLLNYDECYWCSFHITDIEPDDPACEEGRDYDTCVGCPYCEKQAYTIVLQNEKQKKFISP